MGLGVAVHVGPNGGLGEARVKAEDAEIRILRSGLENQSLAKFALVQAKLDDSERKALASLLEKLLA